MAQFSSDGDKQSSRVRHRARVATKTITAASRMLGLKSKHLLRINPSRFLSLKHDSLAKCADCDVVLTFPPNTSEDTLTWILARLRLRTSELKIHVHHHKHTGVYVFYLTQSYQDFLVGAEFLKIPKRLKDEYGGGMKEFSIDEMDSFLGVHDKEYFLTTQQKQAIILRKLNMLHAVAGDQLQDVKFLEGQAIIPKCVSMGIISGIVALHEYDEVNKLRKTWVQAFFSKQPLDEICDYFGVKIAMYFAWLGHYTSALILPTIIGIILWLLSGKNQTTDDIYFVVFAFCNVLWATLYLESWKRSCAELSYRWGTLDKEDELIVPPRPLFTGPLKISLVTGKYEPTYPPWKRNLFRYCVSVPVILLCLLVVFVLMFLIFELQVWWDCKVYELKYPFWLTFFPKILLALSINFMDGIYHKVALWLNDMENYRIEESYQNHLIIKLVMFQFVNSFLSLFYIAFYLQDMDKLRSQLAALLITRQVIGNIKESLIPYIKERMKLFKLSVAHNEAIAESASKSDNSNAQNQKENCDMLTQAEAECAMVPYEGTFEDYLEMFIQFGYVILFSSAFPLAGLCALLNNIIEIRSDAFKLCMIHQRPFGERVENIGTWQDAMEVMGVIAVIVNCALIGMSGLVQRTFPNLSLTGTIILIVVLEHVILSLKFGLAFAIPDIPQWVATAMAKVEFNRREAAKKIVTPKVSIDERSSVSQESTCSVSTQTENLVNFDAISSVGRTYHINLGPQTPDDVFVEQPAETVVHNVVDASLVQPEPDIKNEKPIVDEPLITREPDEKKRKSWRKNIPHLKSIGKSLSQDSRSFFSRNKEQRSSTSSNSTMSPSSANSRSSQPNMFRFPSPKKRRNRTEESSTGVPGTPPPLVTEDDNNLPSYDKSAHSKSRLFRMPSISKSKRVTFKRSATTDDVT